MLHVSSQLFHKWDPPGCISETLTPWEQSFFLKVQVEGVQLSILNIIYPELTHQVKTVSKTEILAEACKKYIEHSQNRKFMMKMKAAAHCMMF